MSQHPLERTCRRTDCGGLYWLPHERSNQVYCSKECAEAVRKGYGHRRRSTPGPHDHRLRIRPTCRWPTPLNLPAMVEAYRTLSLADAAALYGHHWTWLKDLFVKAGVPLRKWGGQPKPGGVKPSRGRKLPPPPIIHHLEPLRRTWPIGALPTGP